MKRYGSVLRLREGMEEEYERHHAVVWPEVLGIIRQGGIHNYTIYRYHRWLFSYFEAADDFSPEAFGQLYMANDTCRRWEALMQTLQEPLPESGEGGWWVARRGVSRRVGAVVGGDPAASGVRKIVHLLAARQQR